MRLNQGHSWWRAINQSNSYNVHTEAVRELYEQHPEWFAMDESGNRPPPESHYAKLETTNEDMVRWFADKAIRSIKANERPATFALSPSDGRGWSKSPESKALYDPSPAEQFDDESLRQRPSMSSLAASLRSVVLRL